MAQRGLFRWEVAGGDCSSPGLLNQNSSAKVSITHASRRKTSVLRDRKSFIFNKKTFHSCFVFSVLHIHYRLSTGDFHKISWSYRYQLSNRSVSSALLPVIEMLYSVE